MANIIVVGANGRGFLGENGKEESDKDKDKSGSGWLSGILGAIPGILSTLFPSGIGGGGSSYPQISQLPNGTTDLKFQSNNNILMYALVLMVGYLVFTGMKPIQPQRKR